MLIKDYFGAIWDADHDYMAHLSPGLQSFINPDDINQLHDFFAMMFAYSI